MIKRRGLRGAKWLCAGILLAGLGARGALLFCGNRGVSADEAVTGLMGKHILEKGERPVYLYGQSSHGGAVLEAWLASFFYRGFGFGAVPLRLAMLLIFLAAGALLALAVWRHFGPQAAVAAAFVWNFGSAVFRFSWIALGGYLESCLLLFLLLYLLAGKGSANRSMFLAGALIGVEAWNLGLAAPVGLCLAVFYGIRRRPSFPAILAGLGLAAAIPGGAWLLAGRPGFSSADLLPAALPTFSTLSRADVLRLFQRDLPGFLSVWNIDNFPAQVPLLSWIGFLLLAFLTGAGAWGSRRAWIAHALAGSLILYLGIYLLSPLSGTSPRHLLPAYAVAVILAGPGLAGLSRPLRWTCASLWLGITAFQTKPLWAENPVVDMVLTPSGGREIRTDQKDLLPVLARLRELRIRHVYATYFLQWRIVFESEEEILASSRNLFPRVSRYPPYDEAVAEAGRYAYVIHRQDALDFILPRRLAAARVPYRREEVGPFVLYLPRGPGGRPTELFSP